MQDIAAGHPAEPPSVHSKLLPRFTEDLNRLQQRDLVNVANDFSLLTSQLPPEQIHPMNMQIETMLREQPTRAMRMLLDTFARTPEEYLRYIKGVHDAAKEKDVILDEWYHRMHTRGIDMYGADWLNALAK